MLHCSSSSGKQCSGWRPEQNQQGYGSCTITIGCITMEACQHNKEKTAL
jgi:hypothetical protein